MHVSWCIFQINSTMSLGVQLTISHYRFSKWPGTNNSTGHSTNQWWHRKLAFESIVTKTAAILLSHQCETKWLIFRYLTVMWNTTNIIVSACSGETKVVDVEWVKYQQINRVQYHIHVSKLNKSFHHRTVRKEEPLLCSRDLYHTLWWK